MQTSLRLITIQALAILVAAALPALAGQDAATIANSGSTNTAGFTITVRADGSAVYGVRPSRMVSAVMKTGRVPASVARNFLSDLKVAKNRAPVVNIRCMKSASFGYSETVSYHGWTSPDLTCPPFGGPIATLRADVAAIVTALNINTNRGGRINLPANEPRKMPVEGVPATMAPPSPQP